MSEPRYPFLSDEWIDAARALRAEFADVMPPPPIEVRANVIVTGSPIHDGDVHGHIDTTAGQVLIEPGLVDNPAVTVTTDYETAAVLFVGRDPQQSMAAFLSGKILVDGDVSQIMLLQAQPPPEAAAELYDRLEALTER